MWVVIKYKAHEFKTLKNAFHNVLGASTEFYRPKIKYQKYINNKVRFYEKNILDNYLICRHEKLKDTNIVTILKNTRGLIHFLPGHQFNQKDINNFVKFCKSNEDQCGFLCQSFFDLAKKTKAKFITGPFAQMMFDIVETKGKKLKALLNNINITISKNNNNLLYS
jgi:hypothetical protein